MSFLFPTLLAVGIPLVAVPILIHLINLRRQQRIRWAAMQFLMESQRRNRRSVLLKQLLLLFTRMAVVAMLVVMLAHLVLRNEWLSMLGRGTTHHLVLLDDSYSMSDHWNDTSALSEGKRAVQSIIEQAGQHSDNQLITLLRFSEAAQLSAGAQPNIFAEQINDTFRSKLESLLASWEPSETDVGPAQALKAIPRLPLTMDGETLLVYLVSDYRNRQFASATEIRRLLADLKETEHVAQIHLIRCVREARSNLAITSLAPESGVRAAGIEMWMSVTVANYGDTPSRGVTIQLEQDGDVLPALVLDDIPARGELKHKFLVQFAGVGGHSLTASLGPDAIDVDNRRYFACNLPAANPVLIIDGSKDGRGGHELALALAPAASTRTGWQPHVERPNFLADAEHLNQQAAVCLLDVPRLADDELAGLETYVRNGGGVAFFLGPDTDRNFYNDRLYHNNEGIFPAPLKLPTQLVEHGDTPDVQPAAHPLFKVLSGRRNGFLPLLMINYFYALQEDWTPPTDGTVQVIAELNKKRPLVIEKRFGKGRVIAHLTKLSSAETPLGKWSNWSINPAFPVLANELASYLAATRQRDPLHTIGDDLIVTVEEGKYDPHFRFLLPSKADGRQTNKIESGRSNLLSSQSSGRAGTHPEVLVDATTTRNQLSAKLEHVIAAGVYQVELQPVNGPIERRVIAVNVPNGEGDLAITPNADISRQLAGIDFYMHDAKEMTLNPQQLAGYQMGDALLVVLVIMLLLEQLLAYIASYHIPPLRSNKK